MYYALIMAGGKGTRLWPLSREKTPKHALKLVDDRTMFQHTVERLSPLFSPEQVFVITGAEHVAVLAEQVEELPRQNFIIEPEGRGTAPAIGLAALHLRRKDPTAVMAVLTADHFITQREAFRKSLSSAQLAAQQGHLVTLGIKPTEPSTGFGYIQHADPITGLDGQAIYKVARFTEKPCLEEAQRMFASSEYSWNSGMFIWCVEDILAEFKRQMPAFYEQLMLVEQVLGTPEYDKVLSQIWPEVSKETIDYGIMEAARNLAVIPVDIGWTDIGSWGSLYSLLPADERGNIHVGETMSLDSYNTLVFGSKRLIATIGLEDIIIVDTEDALLVCARGHEQEVKTIVNRLKEQKKDHLL
ncbi:MAG: mannose-1-phosphate guanylyltransferase [Chloroflexota bacterium]